MFIFHLIAGYRGSGKDCFYSYLNRTSPYDFYIFKSPEFTKENQVIPRKIFENPKITRIGLADTVKDLVHEDLGIKITDYDFLNNAKHYLHFYDKISKQYLPLRYYYIQKGMIMRDIDQDFWCKKALSKLMGENPYCYLVDDPEVINVFITDYRFQNEKAFFEKFGQVITYRVFTPKVNGLDTIGIESEHSLDNEVTDYLVLRKAEDFEEAKKVFPQYFNFSQISFY